MKYQKKAAVATEMKPSTGKRGRRGKGGGGGGGDAMDVVPAVRQKVARNLGEGKAKREAAVDKVLQEDIAFLHSTLHTAFYFWH